MFPRSAIADPLFSQLDRRNAKRKLIALDLDAADTLGKAPVRLRDLSTTGMRFQSATDYELGECLDLSIPEVGTIVATITWKIGNDQGFRYGAEFQNPISHGSVSAAMLAAPTAKPAISTEAFVPDIREAKFSGPLRVLIMSGIAVASWALIGGIVYAMAQ